MSSSSFNSLGLLLIACFLLIVRCSLAQVPGFSRDGTSNSIELLCNSNTFLFYDVNAEFLFQATGDNGLYTFFITPENETAVACTNANSSPRLIFAAFPMLSTPKRKILARIGETQSLMCPYILGVAHTSLDPYHHVWLIDGFEIPNQINQTLLTNTTENSTEVYSCAIKMIGCSDGCTEQIVPDQIDQVKFNITKVEPISIVTSPDTQNITEGNEAVFNCSANGTSIEIIWDYNGTNYTESNQDVGISIVVNNQTSFISSVLTVGDVKANGIVSCIVHQAFDGRLSFLNNEDFNNDLQDDYCSESAFLIVELSPITTTTTTPDFSSTAAMTMEGPSQSPVNIIIACLAIVIVVATTFVISLVIFLYCHYHYKYKRNSSKLGRFLSRAMSKPPKTHAFPYQSNLPADHNGHVLPTCFQSSYSVNHPPTDSGLAQSSIRNGAQEQEQIYNTSQYSGGSYSGLSGVSNQEPGAQHNMPQYCATDVSGGSGNPQTSITSGGRLAPPYHHGNGIGRSSQRLSDASEHSQQSSHGSHPIKLTHEALIEHQHRASSYNSIPNAPQAHSAFVHGTKLPPTTQTGNQYHSDTHLMTARPHNSLFQAKLPSPALATVETDHFPQAFAPFPHNEPEPTQAPFPNEDSNRDTRVSEKTIEEVLDSLMHNRNCRIPNCMCHSARKLYISKMTHKQRPGTLQCQQSSSSSDSDSAIDKRSKLYLPLSSQDISSLHPHFHPGAKMRVRSSNPRSKLSRRRSKSLDLTPVGECPEVSPTNTPKVGGSLVPGTPLYAPPSFQGVTPNENRFSLGEGEKPTLSQSYFYPPTQNSPSPCTPESNLNKLNSLSADNLPTLCLNDCPLSSTPRGEIKALNQLQINQQTGATAGKPALSTINEKNKEADTDGSNTSSRSDSPPNFTKTTQSNPGIRGSKAVKRDLVMSHEDSIGWNSITKDVVDRELSQGYQSETLSSLSISSLKPASRRSYSKPTGSDHSQRSASPAYETYVVVSDDGSTVQTTEC